MTESIDRLPIALVLAAGLGRRLGDMTTALPKALIELNGISLLERTLRALEAAGFHEALVVTGHEATRINGFLDERKGTMHARSLFNAHFAEANNIVSLLCAADALEHGFCLLNSDIIFEPSMLADVSSSGPGTWLVVDGDEPLGAEEMKVQLDDAGFMCRINKALDPEQSAGEYIGIVRVDDVGAALILDSARRLVAEGRTNLYYEDAMDATAANLRARVIGTHGRAWTEVDDLRDYQRAQRVATEIDSGTKVSQ